MAKLPCALDINRLHLFLHDHTKHGGQEGSIYVLYLGTIMFQPRDMTMEMKITVLGSDAKQSDI